MFLRSACACKLEINEWLYVHYFYESLPQNLYSGLKSYGRHLVGHQRTQPRS